MSVEADYRISSLLQAAYRSARKKSECVEAMRKMPSLMRWFSTTEHLQKLGYESALEDAAPEKNFWTARLPYGNGRIDYYVFTDPGAVEKYVTDHWPEAAVVAVLTA